MTAEGIVRSGCGRCAVAAVVVVAEVAAEAVVAAAESVGIVVGSWQA